MKDKDITFRRITTRKGDDGTSSLYNGERRSKDDHLFELLGDIDELGSFIGLARSELAECGRTDDAGLLLSIQEKLFTIGGEAAMPDPDKRKKSVKRISEDDIVFLEENEQRIMEKSEPPKLFVPTGKNRQSAVLDICRTVARRCERRIVTVIRIQKREDLNLPRKYLNRLSDLLFLMARYAE